MSRVRWDRDGGDWPNRAASRFVESGRVRWHVQVAGTGPVVLLLHGTGAATHSWRDLLPALAKHFTVVAPDLPGHGFTVGRPSGGLAMAAIAREIGGLMSALDLVPKALVGHSAGVAIAARMVLDRSVQPRALVGLGAALMPFPGLAAKLFPALARVLFVNPFAPHLLAALAHSPGEVGRFLERSTGSRIDAAGIALYQRLFATSEHCAGAITMMAAWDLASLELARLELPVLLAHGAADAAIPLASVRAAAKLLRDVRVEILPDLGHLAHEEAPDEIAALITAFVEAQR